LAVASAFADEGLDLEVRGRRQQLDRLLQLPASSPRLRLPERKALAETMALTPLTPRGILRQAQDEQGRADAPTLPKPLMLSLSKHRNVDRITSSKFSPR
jgi:hypothetical protein